MFINIAFGFHLNFFLFLYLKTPRVSFFFKKRTTPPHHQTVTEKCTDRQNQEMERKCK